MADKTFKVISIAVTVLLCAVIMFPFIVMLSISLQTMSEVYATKPSLIPAKPMFSNYAEAMRSGAWGRYFLNSLLVTSVTVAVSLIINAMAGYVFARINFKFRDTLFILILIGMMIPAQVTMIPVFSMLRGFPLAGGNNLLGEGGKGLINSYAGLILPFIAGSFGVFLCRQFFIGFPKELDDAAEMDGCGRFRAFFKIYLPLGTPVLASLGVLKFTGTWNEYTWPLVMTNSDSMKTVQLALALFNNESGTEWNLLMAATILVSLAIYVVFIFAQKYFVRGILAGSIKG